MSLRRHDPSGFGAAVRHARLEPPRRRHLRKVLIATVVAFSIGAPAAGALWLAGVVTVDADDISRGQVGFRLTQWDSAGTQVQDVAATSYNSPASFGVTLTAADAGAILGTPPAAPTSPAVSIAIPIRVESLAEGNGGLRYSFTTTSTDPANLLTWNLYPMSGAGATEADNLAECRPTITGTAYTSGVFQSPVIPAPAYDAVVADWWCLVASYDTSKDKTYSNTADAVAEGCTGILPDDPWTGTCPTGGWTVPIPSSASWSATVRPTPGSQPTVTIPLTYVIVRPGG